MLKSFVRLPIFDITSSIEAASHNVSSVYGYPLTWGFSNIGPPTLSIT